MTSRSKAGIVMRSPVRVIPTGDTFHEYHIVYAPMKKRQVSARQAKDYIEEHGLVETLDCEDGTVWDTPDRAFQQRYRGFVKEHFIQFMHYWQQ